MSDDEPIEVVHDDRFGIMPRAIAYAAVSVMAKAVYAVLSQFNQSFPSRQFVAERLGVSVSSVARALKELSDAKFIVIEHRFDANGAQRSSLYRLGAMSYTPPETEGGYHQRHTPRVMGDTPPVSPVTHIRKQREGDNGKEGPRKNYEGWIELANAIGDNE